MTLKAIVDKMGRPSSLLSYIGAVALFLMMSITTVDVVGRYLFNAPILGVYEMTEYLVLLLIFSFLAVTQSSKSHITVDIVASFLPRKFQIYMEMFTHLLCFLLMCLIAWMGFEKALDLMATKDTPPNLGIPMYPFAFFLVLGCILMCIEYLRDLLQLIIQRKELSGS
ncbi:MAG: TRAP transporter small permease [Deltaproteobacteria bacterium]|nr:TRAP transporter small permease [Deltaproteobacteria bacterium]